MCARVACVLALAGVAHAGTNRYTFELREWVVDYQRPTTEPRQMPSDVPTADKMVAMLANNAFPGPVIESLLGDYIEVTVVNQMLAQPVDIHWEGVIVDQSAPEPIQQGGNFTYKMMVWQTGTFWWRATLPLQAARGLKGALMLDDNQEPPDDEQVVVLSDAFQDPEKCLSPSGASDMGCPEIDKATFNGQWGDGSKGYPYPVLAVQQGKCYRLNWLGLQSQNSTSFEVDIESHTASFSVENPHPRASVTTILCADQRPGFFHSKSYKINFTYHGKTMTKTFRATLQYVKSALRGELALNV